MDERRRAERFDIFLYGEVKDSTSGKKLVGRVQNISASGLALNVHHPLEKVQERVPVKTRVRIGLERDDGTISGLDGEVASLREVPVGTDVGIRFEAPSAEVAGYFATTFRPAPDKPPSWLDNWWMLDKEEIEAQGLVFGKAVKGMLGDSGPLENILDRMLAAGIDTVFVEDDVVHAHDEPIFDGFHHRRYRSGDLHRVIHFLRDGDYFGYLVLRPLRMESLSAGAKVFLGRVGRSVTHQRHRDDADARVAPVSRLLRGGWDGTAKDRG